MRSPSGYARFVRVLLCALVLTTRNCPASGDTNSTNVSVEEEDDDFYPDITLEEFKERYRRLIPYMTFFVANNYVDSQNNVGQASSTNEAQSSPLIRTPPQFIRIASVPRRGYNQQTNVQNQDKKFVPSVQFDPRNVGTDNEYFTPVRYSTKINYDEYAVPYQSHQEQNAGYPEITTASSQLARKENRYYANVRPLRPYTTNGRDHQPRKTNKPIHGSLRDNYLQDYNVRQSVNVPAGYPVKDFSGNRYIPPAAYANILDPLPGKQNPPVPQPPRNPNVNLQQILESFHLSERLPEMLNADNIDNSMQTLVEILNILHNKKQEEFPGVHSPVLKPLTQVPASPAIPQKTTHFKHRPQNRPKVVTETRFQVTPNPLYLTEDPERYRVPYDEDTQSKLPSQPSYSSDESSNINDNNKLLEYYVPVVQDIPETAKEPFLPTIRPQTNDRPTDHSYAITEDLSDDIYQEDKFALQPATTESPAYSYTRPNEFSTSQKRIPEAPLTYGATRGQAHVDYPAYSVIPQTNFSCKEQRYKGFFGDPATGCQVWHYCDLNGGKSSFLCPNGTIFSQVALTCDWWFNVKCETTTQLYVLNERLYKYILPIMPKFPEDFTGPEVDRYLELKFKEMEAKLKEKKLKKQKEEKEKLKNKQHAQQKNK